MGKPLCLLISGLLASSVAATELDPRSPLGLWQTYDDASGLLRAIVRIQEKDGQLVGTIDEVFKLPGDKDEDAYCHKCTDYRKGLPVKGMTILTNLRNNGGIYEGGEILDPGNGAVYRCKVRVSDNGQNLLVRGYIGISLFGRSQTWRRVPER